MYGMGSWAHYHAWEIGRVVVAVPPADRVSIAVADQQASRVRVGGSQASWRGTQTE